MATYDNTTKYTLTQQGVVTLATTILDKVAAKIAANVANAVDADDETKTVTGKAVDTAVTAAVDALKSEIETGYWKTTDVDALKESLGVVSQDDITSQISEAVTGAAVEPISDDDIKAAVEAAFTGDTESTEEPSSTPTDNAEEQTGQNE